MCDLLASLLWLRGSWSSVELEGVQVELWVDVLWSVVVGCQVWWLGKAMITTITESAMRQHQSDIDHALVIKLLILNRISRRFRICESVQRVMKPFRAPDRPKSARAALKYITEH